MANPDDSDFDDFVLGAMNATVSSEIGDNIIASDLEDTVLHNFSDEEEDISDEEGVQRNIPGRPNQWDNVSNNDPGPSTTIPVYNVNQGPNLPSSITADSLPIDYFDLFFNDNLINLICTETNYNANLKKTHRHSPHARLNKWTELSSVDLKAFIGTVINMGTMPLPRLESYFTTNWESRTQFYRDVFSKDEFLNIFWNIHFNHHQGQGDSGQKDFLIRPVIEHVRNMTHMNMLFYYPSNRVAIDESTISFKGTVSFKIYNPLKPTKFGLKLFVLSDCCNVFIYDFIPYFGKNDVIPGSELLKTTQIVKSLCQSVILKNPGAPASGLYVYTDRYYTSTELASELLNMNTYLTGTVMPTRKQMPPDLQATTKKLKKGEIISQRNGNILVVSWRDKRVIHMLSTHGKGSKSGVTDVASRWPNKPPVTKPNVVVDYTKHMGAVDRSDHFISSYEFMRRTKKWYRKMVFWLLEVCIIDSYLLYKQVQKDS
ncbi:piggyBac transposable element-derived protein 4-like [Homalodisca vitripennis]|uniref:piggyBac transposable element-derived protein 4-like n=1 Tax=Homalodisca vitripennis TaxID=197043 RepID=UPI001EEAF82B|nr:piggyBac transposable element-derived protein 4-like [Homalodisca vitripennis]